MVPTQSMQQLVEFTQSIRDIGENIDKKSIQSNYEICELLKNSKRMCDEYLNKSFEDSFNI